MKLYHLSDKKLKVINPKYFGKNYHTSNDKNISSVKRAFFYDKPRAQEYLLQDCQYLHTVSVSRAKIYNLTKDPQKILDSVEDIDEALRKIKKNFIGVTYNNGFNCYIIFQSLKTEAVKCIK